MRIDRNIKLIGAFTVCTSLLFHVPVLIPYFQDRIGLGYREFLLAEAAWAAAIVLFDVPTGWVSDTSRRKRTLAIGVAFNILGYMCFLTAHGFLQVIVAEILLGTGFSLMSGTNTALLYDSLLSAGREKEYRRREGKRQALSFYAIAVASVAGGFLYSWNHALPFMFTLLAECLALATVFMLDEPERHRRRGDKHPLADMAETVKYALHGHAEIALVILFSAVMFCASQLIMWAQQPYYLALGLPKEAFGILIGIGFGLGGIASHLGHRLDGKVDTFRAILLAWLAALVVCLGAGAEIGWAGVVLLMTGGSCIFGMVSPRVNEAINQLVGSDRRATILSTSNLATFVLFTLMSALTGWVAGLWGVQASLFAIAGWLCGAGLCLAGWQWKRAAARHALKRIKKNGG